MVDGNKILEIRELYGMNQSEFAKAIGYSREVINKVESGKIKVSKFIVQEVQKFINSHQQADFSQDVNILGKASHPNGKRSTISYLDSRRIQKNETAEYLVPMVGIKAQAGYVKGYEQADFLETLDQYSLPPGVNPTGAVWRYFEIEGDSMEPTFSAGDIVLATMVPIEDWKDIRNFCVYIVHTADQLLIKRLYKKSATEWVLISDNEDLNPQKALAVEDVKQLWMFRRQIRSQAPQPKEFKITA
jgi:phage repressor protein C with HTH and peptisase S24 domain